jgi:hypothetical protein
VGAATGRAHVSQNRYEGVTAVLRAGEMVALPTS